MRKANRISAILFSAFLLGASACGMEPVPHDSTPTPTRARLLGAGLPPQVNAGPDTSVIFPAGVPLVGSATDDDPDQGPLVEWTLTSGPGTLSVVLTYSSINYAVFSEPGVYVLRLTATDAEGLSAWDEFTVTVERSPLNQAPIISEGYPDEIYFVQQGGYPLGTHVRDDGLPNPPGALTTVWSVVSGETGHIFDDPSSNLDNFSAETPGTFVVRLTASDGELTASKDIILHADFAPLFDAGPDQTISVSDTACLQGKVTDIDSPPSAIHAYWLSFTGGVTFAHEDALVTEATFASPGVYTLQLSGNDGIANGMVYDEVVITVLPNSHRGKGGKKPRPCGCATATATTPAADTTRARGHGHDCR